MSELPNGWTLEKFDDVGTYTDYVANGSFASLRENVLQKDDEDYAILLRLKDHTNKFKGPFKYVTKSSYEFLAKSKLEPGDLFLANVGAPGRTFLVPELGKPMTIAPNGIRVRANEKSTNQYLNYFIKSPAGQELITSITGGNAQQKFNKTALRKSVLPIPPLEVQKQLVDKLDSVLAKVEAAQARLDKIPAILKRFRQSVLAAATSGELTKEWRENKTIKGVPLVRNKKLAQINPEDCYTLPISNWCWARLGSVAELINGDRGKNYPNRTEYVEQGVPFINTGHIKTDGTLSHSKMNFITLEKYESLRGGKTRPNDLVYCLRGATMGKIARVNYEKGAIASSLVIIRVDDNINRDFIYYFLNSPVGKSFIKKYDNGSAQPNLSAKSLASYAVYLPPQSEQDEIVSKIDSLFACAESIERQFNSAQANLNKLTQSILAKAFKGELLLTSVDSDIQAIENSIEALNA
ncbi:restriction endonuclease subunit S [Alteromonas macleodii]|uniref:restriction endonuclease subunit S n=1 Tax=Alteromonas macleodii TaxID=28108 RepID=UPI003D02C8D1